MQRLAKVAMFFNLLAVAVALGGGRPTVAGGTRPAQLVDVEAFSMYLNCVGRGSPTVVIEAGVGGWSLHYSHLQEALSDTTRVCTYDRAGLGFSEAGPQPRDASTMADELHRLLRGSGERPPYVLLGHSLGGYVARIYQRRQASEVAGLVLVEAAHERQFERLPPAALQATRARAAQVRSTAAAARAGLIRRDQLPEWAFAAELRASYEDEMLDAVTYETIAAELEAAEQSAAQVPTGDLGDLPLVVVSAGDSFAAFEGTGVPIEQANAVWHELQKELAGLSTASAHLTSPRSDHRIHREDPDLVLEGARLVIDMVRDRDTAGLPDPMHRLPHGANERVDELLSRIEQAYRSMDVDAFVGLFTDDFEQLDVARRVLVQGKDAWRSQTEAINASHRWMERVHHGRASVRGGIVVVEIEWAGQVRGAPLETGKDGVYRYVGLGILELRDGRIARQVLFADFNTLARQLGLGFPEW